MSDANRQRVTDFCMSWLKGMGDFNRYVAEDLVYQNVPLEPIHGRANAYAFLEPFIAPQNPRILEDMRIPHSASHGDIVMNERLEIWVKGDLRVELAVMGTFRIRDGVIVEWRDYFNVPDLQPLLDAVLG